MSWRTQGHHKGLSDLDQDWLKEFDRSWDTKAHGRSQTDALDRCTDLQVHKDLRILVLRETNKADLEASLIRLAMMTQTLTVPRQTKSGWSIHLVFKSGEKIRVHFKDAESAEQSYYALDEFIQWFLDT